MYTREPQISYRLHQKGCSEWLRGSNSTTPYSLSLERAIVDCVSVTKDSVTFDTSTFSEMVFPTPRNMIFISHAHSEKDIANQIARYIEEKLTSIKPVRCFIDSDYWGSVYRAMDILKSRHALKSKPDDLYWCMPCTEISKNLFMILSMALQKAIRDSLMFLFVPPADQEETDTDLDTLTTSSPWIAQELLTSSLIPEYHKMEKIAESVMAASAPPPHRF